MVLYSIIATEILHPMEDVYPAWCVKCPGAWSSVYKSACSLVQTVVLGDSWSDLFTPLFIEQPLVVPFVAWVFMIVNFGLMNLIAAVIVDCAQQARISNTKMIARERNEAFVRSKNKLYKMCREMDVDGDDTLTQEELMTGFKTNKEFAALM